MKLSTPRRLWTSISVIAVGFVLFSLFSEYPVAAGLNALAAVAVCILQALHVLLRRHRYLILAFGAVGMLHLSLLARFWFGPDSEYFTALASGALVLIIGSAISATFDLPNSQANSDSGLK